MTLADLRNNVLLTSFNRHRSKVTTNRHVRLLSMIFLSVIRELYNTHV